MAILFESYRFSRCKEPMILFYIINRFATYQTTVGAVSLRRLLHRNPALRNRKWKFLMDNND